MKPGKSTEKTRKSTNWWLNHRKDARSSLARMRRTPISTAMTVFVIAVALLLPTLLFSVNAGFQRVLSDFRESARLTLYLTADISEERAIEVREDLLTSDGIAAVEYISSSQALTEFESAAGFRGIAEQLDANPLPAALVITPNNLDVARLRALSEDLLTLPEVELVQLDEQWIQRLASLSNLVTAVARTLGVIMLLGLGFIIGNTIKLGVEARRDEIRVIKLVGGTNAYIARPLLYSGLFHGLFGAATACILAVFVQLNISIPLQGVAAEFDSDLSIISLGAGLVLQVLLAGSLAGWVAALLASFRYIRAIDP